MRVPGLTFSLYFGRGGESQGLGFFSTKLVTSQRIYDSFLGLIRSLILGTFLRQISRLTDNTFLLKFTSKDTSLDLVVSWVDEKLYFSYMRKSESLIEMLVPWEDPRKKQIQSEDEFFRHIDSLKKNKSFKILGLPPEAGSFEIARKTQHKSKKNLQKKIENIRNDLRRAQSWREWEVFAQKAVTGEVDLEDIQSYEIGSLKIKFKRKKHHHKIDEIYQQIKRFKAKESFIQDRYKTVCAELDQWNDMVPLKKKAVEIRKPVWVKLGDKKNQRESVKHVLRGEISTRIGRVMIGRSAQENDNIRKNWAKKDDLWFHFEEIPGPHLFLKKSDESLGNEEISAICSLLMSVSDKNLVEAKFVYTLVKHLKGVKGSQGLVTYQKAKFIRVKYNNDWRQILSILLEET